MTQGANTVSWFEIPVSNFERAVSFYETVFSMKLEINEMDNYKMGFFPAESGKVSGAICFGEGYTPSGAGSLLYLNANPDLNLVLDKVPASGGKVIVPKTLISSDVGYYAFIIDTEGNRLALHSDR